MKVITHTLAGAPRRIYYPERDADLEPFRDFLARPRRALAVDTETTGLNIYGRDFRVRLVQFGDTEEAWVLRAADFPSAVEDALRTAPRLVAHNATYDLLALDRVGLGDLDDLYPRTFDTAILAHLLDPRMESEGGIGLSLKRQAAHHVDPDAPDGDKALQAEFRRNGWTKVTGWALIPDDHPDYVRYAGLDVLLTARLFDVLGPRVVARGMERLAQFEHALALILARMQRKGFHLDVPYAEGLVEYLRAEEAAGVEEAARWGVANVSAPRQVAAALEALGADLHERTATGQPKTDRAVLAALAEHGGPAAPLAAAVLRAKQAHKFRLSYVEASLEGRDEADRVHPMIAGLRARTARMSISSPPLQQLPSGDWRIRRMFVAPPGDVIVAADYSQVELRVLAALSEDRRMREVIAEGVDLHDATAAILFGPNFTKAQRKLAKTVAFGKVYGGGIATLARQSGAGKEEVRRAVEAYDRAYPGIRRYSRRLQDRAEWGAREVVTPSGRHLPLDRDRLYAATNYVVQSTARDVLAQALLDLDAAGLGDRLILPVHDEVIAHAAPDEAEDVARALQETMTMDFRGVRLDADAEVYGPSWGHGYGAPE